MLFLQQTWRPRALAGVDSRFEAEDCRFFIAALLMMGAIAAARFVYCISLKIAYVGDRHAIGTALALFALSLLLTKLRLYAISTIGRAIALGALFIVCLPPSVTQIYYTGRAFPLADGMLSAIDHALASTERLISKPSMTSRRYSRPCALPTNRSTGSLS